MLIINKNGTFELNAAQYNYLMATFQFDEIDERIVKASNFINSTWEWDKADEIFHIISR